jgi:predicted nucleotidyltransferase
VSVPRAQSVADADRDIRLFLIRIAATLGDILGDTLSGLYVYGSLASGSYYRERSDVDLLGLASRKLNRAEREATARALVALSDSRPVTGDIEVTLLQERYARAYEHPLPYEVHYSQAHRETIRRGGIDYAADATDVDLAAQIVDARQRGVALVGAPAASVFGPVPWFAYIDALHADFEWAASRVKEQPLYAVLNACRTLHGATARSIVPLDKAEAGIWALSRVPEQHRSVINDALHVHRGNKSGDDVVFFEDDITAFRSYVFDRSRSAFERASDTGEEEDRQ